MPKNLDEIEFSVFDTETTGLEPDSGDRIVEIAAIKVRGSDKTGTFHSLINPRRPISDAAYAVNGITSGMLKGAPLINEVLPGFLNFIKDTCLVSYNAPFDLSFLRNELKLSGLQLSADTPVIDVLTMARRLLPGLERYTLWFVAERLGVSQKQKHRAFSDVEITLEVFYRLKNILQAKGIAEPANFFGLFGVNPRFLENINEQKTAKIQEALGLGVKLKIKYFSASGAKVSEREVIPKEIKEEKGRKYLVGHCCLKNEERTFRIDGILHLEIV